jgi:hypothetical protein
MRKIVSLATLLLLSMGLISCSAADGEPVFQVTPTELFTGDAVKFKPFLENAGAVQVKYSGEKESIRLLAEVWVNGELQDIHPQLGGFLTKETKHGLRTWNGEVIVSIDVTENEEGHSRYTAKSVFFEDDGHVSYGYTFDADEAHTAFGHIPLGHEQRVSPEDGELAIWGFQATSQNILHATDLTPEQLKQTDWAIVFNLAASDVEN